MVATMLDKTSVNTELGTSNMVTATITGSGGFAGTVDVTGKVVDGAGAAVPGYSVTLDKSSVTLTENGSATVVATIKIDSNATVLSGALKIETSSSAAASSAQASIVALNQVTFKVTANAQGQCVIPTGSTTTVKVGTKVRFLNGFTSGDNITIHVQKANNDTSPDPQGNNHGIPHEGDPGHAMGLAYERTVANAGTDIWYCHAPAGSSANAPVITIEP